MVTEGEELLLGVSHDPVFGPVITVGLGGIFVEIMRDVALARAPVSNSHAMRMLQSLRSYPVLNGARGRPVLDVEAAADAIVRLSWLAVDAGERLSELDINPLKVLPRGRGARVIDALAIRAGEH
jgi:acyl-CoA synthetase (NDP forming)